MRVGSWGPTHGIPYSSEDARSISLSRPNLLSDGDIGATFGVTQTRSVAVTRLPAT